LLIESIRDEDPVIFCEHKLLYEVEGEVPDEAYTIPLGEADIPREGEDLTIVALGRMVHMALEAAETLAEDGIDCEVVDLRTTSPLDEDSVIESVENTGRLVVVDEANPRCNIATDVSALVAQNAFGALKAPIKMVTPPHVPVPFSDALEDLYIPDAARIAEAVRGVMEHR
jgi:pyruvate dehydrogenase E1 component beta subunit